jgi:hypothetical protein
VTVGRSSFGLRLIKAGDVPLTLLLKTRVDGEGVLMVPAVTECVAAVMARTKASFMLSVARRGNGIQGKVLDRTKVQG